jgi:hypothetical protein
MNREQREYMIWLLWRYYDACRKLGVPMFPFASTPRSLIEDTALYVVHLGDGIEADRQEREAGINRLEIWESRKCTRFAYAIAAPRRFTNC